MGFSYGRGLEMALHAYIIAGEQSGDQLGAHLIDGLKELEPAISLSGVGGSMMHARGFRSLFDMSDLSVMGLVEVLPKLPKLLRRIRETVEDIIRIKPDVLVTIDSPDFCLRVAKKVRRALPNLKVVHYVAPSVWAWRPHRAVKMAAHVDHVLALLPFEPAYMEAAGMSCDFVGHPVASIVETSRDDAVAFRLAHGIAEKVPLLCLLPGSRQGEVARHASVFFDIVRRLTRDIPDLQIVLPAAPTVFEQVNVVFSGLENVTVLDPNHASVADKFAAFAASDAALAVSGTVSLELASQNTPMVIAYDAAPITKLIMKRAFLLDTATLVNIVSDTKAVPEFIFDDFKADKITSAVKDVLNGSGLEAQTQAAAKTMHLLGRGGEPAGIRAAKSVLSVIQ